MVHLYRIRRQKKKKITSYLIPWYWCQVNILSSYICNKRKIIFRRFLGQRASRHSETRVATRRYLHRTTASVGSLDYAQLLTVYVRRGMPYRNFHFHFCRVPRPKNLSENFHEPSISWPLLSDCTYVSHMTTRPPWCLAALSAISATSTSSKQKRHVSPRPLQLQL